jgi:hypothetical protein
MPVRSEAVFGAELAKAEERKDHEDDNDGAYEPDDAVHGVSCLFRWIGNGYVPAKRSVAELVPGAPLPSTRSRGADRIAQKNPSDSQPFPAVN